jgi:hypothetical protein
MSYAGDRILSGHRNSLYEPESSAREAATGVTGDLSVVGWLFGNQFSTGTGISSKGGPWEPRAFERPSKATLKLIQTNALPVADLTVFGIRVPADATFSSLISLLPVFLVYIWSFQTVGTYWNNKSSRDGSGSRTTAGEARDGSP